MERNLRKERVGLVCSDKMDKTVVVLVEYRIMHPLYKKYVKRYEKFKAHDSDNSCKMGDVVKIESCKPISKEKKWKVVEILSHAK